MLEAQQEATAAEESPEQRPDEPAADGGKMRVVALILHNWEENPQ